MQMTKKETQQIRKDLASFITLKDETIHINMLKKIHEIILHNADFLHFDSQEEIIHFFAKKTSVIFEFIFSAVFLYTENNDSLELSYCSPPKNCIDTERITTIFYDSKIVEKTFRNSKYFIHSLPGVDAPYYIKRISTTTSNYGIFVAQFPNKNAEPSAESLTLLSLLLQQCAVALEAYNTYKNEHEKNSTLVTRLRTLIQSEVSLQNSQRMLRLVLENVPLSIFWKDVGQTYLGCNCNFAKLIGLDDPGRIAGLTDAELRWNDQELFFCQETDKKVLEYGTIVHEETEITGEQNRSILHMDVRKLPLVNSSGQVVGILGTMQNITKRKAYEKQLNHMALHDCLTDLPNRTLCLERMGRAIQRMRRRRNYKFAVLMLDLDHFKMVNDTYGHPTGDKMLLEVAKRIQRSIRTIDTVCRLGGDEFAILLEEYSLSHEVIAVVERLQRELKAPYDLHETSVYSSASIGVVLNTTGYTNPETILRDADIAMYCAKEEGQGLYRIFNDQMHHTARRITSISNDIYTGLDHEQFFLTYQPIYQLSNSTAVKTLSGFEVLLRWQHPEHGVLYPKEFLSIAEQSGFIIELGEWVTHTACSQFADWKRTYSLADSLALSINVSARQLNWSGLKKDVLSNISDNGLPPGCISLEFKENAIMGNADETLNTLHQLTEAGVALALDDFGTGYSSLPYLFRMPVHSVKIDKSLIESTHNHSGNSPVVNTMISLASNLKLKVTAEGVEHEDQFSHLVRSGCNHAQGNFFSPPLTVQEVQEMLEKESR